MFTTLRKSTPSPLFSVWLCETLQIRLHLTTSALSSQPKNNSVAFKTNEYPASKCMRYQWIIRNSALLLLILNMKLPAGYSPKDSWLNIIRCLFLFTIDKFCFIVFKKQGLTVTQKISYFENSRENVNVWRYSKLNKYSWWMMSYVFQKYTENFTFQLFIIWQ